MAETRIELEALFKSHHRKVLAYCARRTSIADAWDATADVFVVALRRLDDVPTHAELPWLLGIARRVLANQRRSRRRKERLFLKASAAETASVLPEEPVVRSEEHAEVVAALERLRPIDREIIELRLWEELTPVEIAALLGISRAAVDKRYSRARQRLSRQLGVEGDATPDALLGTREKGVTE